MSYEVLETSVEEGRPVELYTFTIGDEIFRYTSSEDTVIFSSLAYLPKQIARTDPTLSSDERRAEIQITLPTEDAVARKFIGIVPGVPILLQIISFHRGDAEAIIIWEGRVIGASFQMDGAQCMLRSVTSEAAFSRTIPRYKFQSLCNHVLYDGGCQVAKIDFTYIGSVIGEAGNTVTVNGLSATVGADFAPGGYIARPDGTDFRLVLSQSGDILSLPLPFEQSVFGQTVHVIAGCDHTVAECVAKFDNIVNYGGFPYVPSKNPFQVGVRR
jgi:uncharacterized phage protein (TIGR02218 family)